MSQRQLSRGPLAVLAELQRARGALVTRERLFAVLAANGSLEPNKSLVKVYVTYLRNAGHNVENVYGEGYRLPVPQKEMAR